MWRPYSARVLERPDQIRYFSNGALASTNWQLSSKPPVRQLGSMMMIGKLKQRRRACVLAGRASPALSWSCMKLADGTCRPRLLVPDQPSKNTYGGAEARGTSYTCYSTYLHVGTYHLVGPTKMGTDVASQSQPEPAPRARSQHSASPVSIVITFGWSSWFCVVNCAAQRAMAR